MLLVSINILWVHVFWSSLAFVIIQSKSRLTSSGGGGACARTAGRQPHKLIPIMRLGIVVTFRCFCIVVAHKSLADKSGRVGTISDGVVETL